MKDSFYKYFNCNNKEELYLKLKQNSIDTHKLGKYLKFNQEKENKKIVIRGQYKLFDYLKNNIPDRDEVQIIMFNSNMEVLSDNKFPINTQFKDILDKSYVETANHVILLSHENEYNKLLRLEMDFELFGYKIIDRIELDKNLELDSKNGIGNYQFTEEDIINGKNETFSFREEFLLSNYSYERSSNKELSISEKEINLKEPVKNKIKSKEITKEKSTRNRLRSRGQER